MMHFVAVISVILLFQNGVFGLTCPYKGVPCAPYEVKENGNGYEKRLYAESNWACASMDDTDLDKVRGLLAKKIHAYTSGANVQGKSVEKTKPWLYKVEPGNLSGYTFTLCLYIMEDPVYQATDPVWTTTLPEVTVFVREFSGNSKWADYNGEKTALTSSLNAAGKGYVQNKGYLAVYDSPHSVAASDRLNEVWVIAS